ncbi:hypothetical protein FOA52_003357 [Chlamydomonas sp. UWO 241]|nr:hypothetical protein FOA52_003357 [Chlamydomonas sp. UWO 241]
MPCYNLPTRTWGPYMQLQATHHGASVAGMLRVRSAVAWQHSRRSLGAVVVRAQPGPHQNPPAAVSNAWLVSQRAWVDVALNQPVELSGTDAKGAAWSSRVHVLGVAHNSAANVRSLHEVSETVKPDAVAFEEDTANNAWRNLVTKISQAAPMKRIITRLMDTPLTSYQQAHGLLSEEEREEWADVLKSAGVGLGPFSEDHRLLGMPTYSDPIAAAFIARKLGATLAFIECPDGRRMYAEALAKLQGELRGEAYTTAVWSRIGEAHGESLAASFRRWAESEPESKLLQRAVRTAMAEAVTPETTPITLKADPQTIVDATAQRERGMCRTIVDLCSGKLAGKPRKRVLAIVGGAHVAPLIELLKAV